jgi:hypothetical protein
LKKLASRLVKCGLELHPDKTKIVYCKDKNRKENNEEIQFEFLGYAFRPRRCVNKKGEVHPNFLPAISNASKKAISKKIRSWHMQLKNDKSLVDLSKTFNPVLTGWANYYGAFYPSALNPIWRSFNEYLIKWARRKYKGLSWHKRKAREYINRIARAKPHLFIHLETRGISWRQSGGSCMSGDVHVQFLEGLRVKSPRSTQPYIRTQEGWLYLAVVIDLYSRAVISWSMDKRMKKNLVCDALSMALFRRKFPTGVIVHSDRGSQYCSLQYQQMITQYQLIGSMSRKANCWDNLDCRKLFPYVKS